MYLEEFIPDASGLSSYERRDRLWRRGQRRVKSSDYVPKKPGALAGWRWAASHGTYLQLRQLQDAYIEGELDEASAERICSVLEAPSSPFSEDEGQDLSGYFDDWIEGVFEFHDNVIPLPTAG